MHMHRGSCPAHRGQNVQIGLPRVIGMNAALHAHFGRAALPCLAGSAHDFLAADIVGFATQVLAVLALGKRAELAFEITHVGVIDIAVDHVTDPVTADFPAQGVRRAHHKGKLGAAHAEQPRHVELAEFPGVTATLHYLTQIRSWLPCPGRCIQPGGLDCRYRPLFTGHPVVAPGITVGVGVPEHCRPHVLIQPATTRGNVGRVNGQALIEKLARGGGFPLEFLQVRPGRLGIHVVGRQG